MIRLAWRNIWRNRRRTILTVIMIAGAVFFAVSVRCLNWGMYEKMIDTMAGGYTGYIQVMHPDYWKERNIDLSFAYNDSLEKKLKKEKGVTNLYPRIESGCMVSSGPETRFAALIGMDKSIENNTLYTSSMIVKGKDLVPGDDGIIVDDNLAQRLKITVGDTLVLLGSGYHGTSAAGKFPVRGLLSIVRTGVSRGLVILDLKKAQWFFDTPGMITSLLVIPENKKDCKQLSADLSKLVAPKLRAMHWEEMQPDLRQAIDADSTTALLMLGILYMVLVFGIFSTILMMVSERIHEFGILISIGMRKTRISFMLFLEMTFISLLGIIAGLGVSVPLIQYFISHPIKFTGRAGEAMMRMGIEPTVVPTTDPEIFFNHCLLIFIFTLTLMIYPIFTIRKLKPVEAMKR